VEPGGPFYGPIGMNWFRPLALVLLAAAVPACAVGSSSSTSGELVRTRGVIVTVGGPPPGAPRPIAGAEFKVDGSAERATVRADRHGLFAFDLSPGTYRITITGHAPMSGSAFIQPRHPTIVVRPQGGRIRIIVDIR
jgi:hypothetical protein